MYNEAVSSQLSAISQTTSCKASMSYSTGGASGTQHETLAAASGNQSSLIGPTICAIGAVDSAV
jgi:hypothetical protein